MQSIHPARKSPFVRVSLVAAVLVLLAFVGLRPAAPALASCGGVTGVSTQVQLNGAIALFNAMGGNCVFGIEFEGDILMGTDPVSISNNAPGVELVIEGAGFKIDGMDMNGQRPITVLNGVVSINNLTITGGNVANANGGGIYNDGDLTLTNVTVEGNNAIVDDPQWGLGGGGIANTGKVTIADSVISGNTVTADSGGRGGGILNLGKMSISRSTVGSNEVNIAGTDGRGGGIFNGADLLIRDSAIIYNSIESGNEGAYGAGIYSWLEYEPVEEEGHDAHLMIINSTISNNSSTTDGWALGGGIYAEENMFADNEAPALVTLINVTVTENSLTTQNQPRGGSGMYFWPLGVLNVYVDNSIIAGNLANNLNEEDCRWGAVAGEPTLWSRNSLYQSTGDHACRLNPADPDGNIFGVAPDLGPLADNGGPTLTHLPNPTSPAIDAGRNDLALDEYDYPLMADQRGFVDRSEGERVDMGAVEVGARDPEAEVDAVYMSATASGATTDGLSFDNSDILMWDGTGWSMFFDGSAALLAPNNKSKHNVNAFWIPDVAAPDAVMSFAQNARKIPGLADKVDGMDLVWWDGASFSLWFDGSDVGLTKKTPEKIDGLHVLPGDNAPDMFSGACLHYLLISTQGPGAVPQFGGGTLKFGGEDVLGFCATNVGANTTGFWHMALDGSAVGVKKNAIDSISQGDDGVLYLTSKAAFNVDFAVGGHSMVYAYVAGGGGGGGAGGFPRYNFSGPHFRAADNGLLKKVDGLQVSGSLLD